MYITQFSIFEWTYVLLKSCKAKTVIDLLFADCKMDIKDEDLNVLVPLQFDLQKQT